MQANLQNEETFKKSLGLGSEKHLCFLNLTPFAHAAVRERSPVDPFAIGERFGKKRRMCALASLNSVAFSLSASRVVLILCNFLVEGGSLVLSYSREAIFAY